MNRITEKWASLAGGAVGIPGNAPSPGHAWTNPNIQTEAPSLSIPGMQQVIAPTDSGTAPAQEQAPATSYTWLWVLGSVAVMAATGLALWYRTQPSRNPSGTRCPCRRRNPSGKRSPWDDEDVDKFEIQRVASEWHGGQWSSLYAVSSSLYAGNAAALTKADVGGAIRELEKGQVGLIEIEDKDVALDGLRRVYDLMPDDGSEE